MAEQILTYALTTVSRMNTRLGITTSTNDVLLARIISGVTDFIEGECGRRFKETTYSNEVYSIEENQKYLILKNAPVTAITSLQYKAGTPTTPSWTDYNDDDYELMEDGSTGIVGYFGNFVSGMNKLRASYTAGYKINFSNAGDMSTHTLPADITELCERLTTKIFKKRDAEGRSNESFEGGSVNWAQLLDDSDKDIISRYKRGSINFS